MAKNRKENPMFTKKGAWLWVLCAPAAPAAAAFWDAAELDQKRSSKQKKKNDRFAHKYSEFDIRQDRQGM